MKLLIEAVVVGLSVVIFGTLASFLVGSSFRVELPPVCDDWNKNYAMEISLFLTGVLAHLFFEVTGVNKWYCKNGNACSRK